MKTEPGEGVFRSTSIKWLATRILMFEKSLSFKLYKFLI